MDLEGLIAKHPPPAKRARYVPDSMEHHLYEGAVMVAFAMQLLRVDGAERVNVHPDGEHGKRFDFFEWLIRHGFRKISGKGSTTYGGIYENAVGQSIIISPKPGLGDVVAETKHGVVSAECKGGIVNTRHPGQVSRLRKGLCEVIGMLMAVPRRGRQVAVVPLTDATQRLAKKLRPRCAQVGIEIALVNDRGQVRFVTQSQIDPVMNPAV